MFRRQNKEQGIQGIKSSPNSNFKSFILAIFVVGLGIWSLLNPVEVVKWLGYPFMILPNVLGIVDRPGNDEIVRIVGPQGSEHTFELTQTGVYNLHRSFWDEWAVEQGYYPRIIIEGPSGRVRQSSDVRSLSPFYPPHAPGLVKARIEITEPGIYTARYSRSPDSVRKNFDASLVPDYLTGNETAVSWAFWIQLVIILAVVGVWLYVRKIKPGLAQLDRHMDSQLEKRETMDDFLADLKRGDQD